MLYLYYVLPNQIADFLTGIRSSQNTEQNVLKCEIFNGDISILNKFESKGKFDYF